MADIRSLLQGSNYRNWVHGSDVNVGWPDRPTRLQRTSSATKVWQDEGTFNNFHFAIPTPTGINNDQTISIEEVYLQARIVGSEIERVEVHDGSREIHRETVNLSQEELDVTININKEIINSAINFTIHVDFVSEVGQIDSVGPLVELIAAGAQFDTSNFVFPKPDLEREQEGKVAQR